MQSPAGRDDDFFLLRQTLDQDHAYETVTVRLDEVAEQAAPRWLAPAELEIYRTLRAARRKREWLAGRLAAKTAVGRLLALPLPRALTDICIPALAGGKPLVHSPRPPGLPVEVSISHSGELAAAMAARFACGIDVQQLSAAAVRVRERFSSPAEVAVLAGLLPLLAETEQLCLLWAAKEALRKMVSAAPVAGFHELQLLAGETAGRRQALLRFSFTRVSGPAALQVAVFLRPGYAWAMSGRGEAGAC
jgi:phosphopantetheinyl transferase